MLGAPTAGMVAGSNPPWKFLPRSDLEQVLHSQLLMRFGAANSDSVSALLSVAPLIRNLEGAL